MGVFPGGVSPHQSSPTPYFRRLVVRTGPRHNEHLVGQQANYESKTIEPSMDPMNEKPYTCHAIGMNCQECVSRSAQQLAVACGSMPYRDVEQLFHVMYDHEVCSRLSGEFIRCYHSSTEPAEESGFSFLPEPAYCF